MPQIERQLTLGYGVVLTAIAVTAVVSLGALLTTAREQEEVARSQAEALQRVSDLRLRAEQVVTAARAYLVTADPRYLDSFHLANDAFAAILERVPVQAGTPKAADLSQIRGGWSRYIQAAELGAHRRAVADNQGVIDFFERVLSPDRDALESALDRLERDERDTLAETTRRSRRDAQRAGLAVGFTTLVGLSVSVWLAAATRRKLSGQVGALRAATTRAERAAAARDELISVVSHDLRSPLAAILMNAQMLDRRLSPDAAPARRLLERLESAANLMHHLLEELVEVARVDGPGIVLHWQRCDVTPLVDEVLNLFEPQAAQKAVRLRAAVLPEPPSAFADRERICRVLSNLCGNAVKFTPAGGEVTLRVERDEGAFLRFSVSDTGPGISPAELPRLFEKHWQAHRGGEAGLGLGLYIARHLVEAHGGRLCVDSTVGVGSTFSFRVPVTG